MDHNYLAKPITLYGGQYGLIIKTPFLKLRGGVLFVWYQITISVLFRFCRYSQYISTLRYWISWIPPNICSALNRRKYIMHKSISNGAFYLVSFNVIIFQILIAKIALSYVVFWVLDLIGKLQNPAYIMIGVYLIASIASIIIGILGYIKGTRILIEKIKRIQTIMAVFVIIIMVPLALFLSFITPLIFLLIGNA